MVIPKLIDYKHQLYQEDIQIIKIRNIVLYLIVIYAVFTFLKLIKITKFLIESKKNISNIIISVFETASTKKEKNSM